MATIVNRSPHEDRPKGTRHVGIGEPSFADAIAAIEVTPLLGAPRKRHLITSLRQVARYLGLPVESVPARFAAIQRRVAALHPTQLRVNPKTFRNHRSNVRAALLFFNRLTLGSARGSCMADDFRRILTRVGNRHARDVLSPFFRYLTAIGVAPDDVSDRHVGSYVAFRAETGFQPMKSGNVRLLVRNWNRALDAIPEWPRTRLTEPSPSPASSGPAWDAFPQGLRSDIEAYLDSIAHSRRDARGRRLKACARSTIAMRRRELVAAVRTGVAAGIPIEGLTSLRALLAPENVRTIIDRYWSRDGKEPSTYTINLAWRFLAIARSLPGVDDADLEALTDIWQAVEQFRRVGLTDKNLAVVRQVLHSDIWSKVVQLPRVAIAKAKAMQASSPERSAVLAQLAAAVAILTVAPARVQNLAAIRLGINLVRPGGPATPYLLTFPDYDVKNRVSLDFPLPAEVSELIDEYIFDHRPILMRGRDHDLLFPGTAAEGKLARGLGVQIQGLLEKALGLKVTPHQFRHAAAAILLRARPGNYELVRRLLGHRNIQTTTRFYVGLETMEAAREYGAIVGDLILKNEA